MSAKCPEFLILLGLIVLVLSVNITSRIISPFIIPSTRQGNEVIIWKTSMTSKGKQTFLL